MKKLIPFIFLSSLLFGSGKLELSSGYHPQSGKFLGQAGLSVYESIGLGFQYDSFTGFGDAPRVYQPSVFWVASRHDIEYPIGDLTIGIGATLRLMFQEGFKNENENNIHATLSYKIW